MHACMYVYVCVLVDVSVVECENLTSLENGRVEVVSNEVNGSAVFTCDEGFFLNGSSSVECQENGEWSEQLPTCQGEGD